MKLLLAEDERPLSEAVTTLLVHSGYAVDDALDGEEALRLAEENRYDGILLDIMMPKADGLTVLRTLRARGDCTPVLMLTAKSEVDDRVAGLDQGANDYLGKPFSIRELLSRIRAMLRTQEERIPREIRLPDARADRAELTLEGPEGSVSLSAREFALLELLAGDGGKPLARAVLLEKLWDGEADGGAAEVYVSYLRNKLRAVGSASRIAETGDGWCLRTS